MDRAKVSMYTWTFYLAFRDLLPRLVSSLVLLSITPAVDKIRAVSEAYEFPLLHKSLLL